VPADLSGARVAWWPGHVPCVSVEAQSAQTGTESGPTVVAVSWPEKHKEVSLATLRAFFQIELCVTVTYEKLRVRDSMQYIFLYVSSWVRGIDLHSQGEKSQADSIAFGRKSRRKTLSYSEASSFVSLVAARL